MTPGNKLTPLFNPPRVFGQNTAGKPPTTNTAVKTPAASPTTQGIRPPITAPKGEAEMQSIPNPMKLSAVSALLRVKQALLDERETPYVSGGLLAGGLLGATAGARKAYPAHQALEKIREIPKATPVDVNIENPGLFVPEEEKMIQKSLRAFEARNLYRRYLMQALVPRLVYGTALGGLGGWALSKALAHSQSRLPDMQVYPQESAGYPMPY